MNRTTLAPLSLVLLALAGCAGGSGTIGEGPIYPDIAQSQVLDVQAFRDETDLTLINTSERAFGPSRMWVNHRYSRDIPGLAVGEKITLNLYDFKDRYAEDFRAGGFFATQRPDRVALLQIQEGDAIYGLVITGETQ